MISTSSLSFIGCLLRCQQRRAVLPAVVSAEQSVSDAELLAGADHSQLEGRGVEVEAAKSQPEWPVLHPLGAEGSGRGPAIVMRRRLFIRRPPGLSVKEHEMTAVFTGHEKARL